MTCVLVTGAAGFIGQHVVELLGRREGVEVTGVDRETSEADLHAALRRADAVIHLAGANRPTDDQEFRVVNVDYTEQLTRALADRAVPVVFSSSTHAGSETAYGRSKRGGEEVLAAYAAASDAAVTVFRLPNVFGKWARPHYNSFVATLCYSVARGEPYTISDPDRALELVYIDDVAKALVDDALSQRREPGVRFGSVAPVYPVTLGDLARRIESFRAHRESLVLPDFSDPLTTALYATFLSHLRGEEFAYSLAARQDARGSLAEFVKSPAMGQIFVSRTLPGVTRGNHYHHTKTEKFLVVEGEGIVRFRHIETGELVTHRVCGRDYRVVDIPPGYTHSIENVGRGEMVTVFWASEIFDATRPDTYARPVLDVVP